MIRAGRSYRLASLLSLGILAACSSGSSSPPDGGTPDGGMPDAGSPDGGSPDGGNPTTFPTTADSITATPNGARSDPEGVAPPASSTTKLTWYDAAGAPRSLILGGYLYQYDFQFTGGTSDLSAVTSVSANDDAYGHPGFGYVVSHNTQTGNSPLGKVNAPSATTATVFSGAHHAVYRVTLTYDRDKEAGGEGIQIPVVIDWFVATGRDHPVWAVTWKMGQAANPNAVSFDSYRMDTRGPYGSLNFDGAASRSLGDEIGGVAWGDAQKRFVTTSSPLTMQASWDYSQDNDVAFTRAWTTHTNAEMGIVQTRTGDGQMGYPDRVAGRERGVTSADAFLDKGDCTGFGDSRVYSMPCVDGWPYQLMNYDWEGATPLDQSTGTKLIAWGSPYGFLGASTFDGFGGSADGRGDRSYSTFIVLGPECRWSVGGTCDQPGVVQDAIAEVEALNSAQLAVSHGALVTEAPKGPGASQTKALSQGYDDTYATYQLDAASDGQVALTFSPASAKPIQAPIFVVHHFTGMTLPTVKVDGVAVTVNAGDQTSGAFASLEGDTLWVTLNRTVSQPTQVKISP